MSLNIDKVLHTLKAVSHNAMARTNHLQGVKTGNIIPRASAIYAPPGLVLPAHLVNNAEVDTKQQFNYEEIEFLIEALGEIKEARSAKPFGFRPNPKDKEEVELANKADKLEQSLWDHPTQANIRAAKKFIKVISIINALEGIAEERNELNFGFNKTSENNNDTKLADKALDLARELKISCIKGTILKEITKPALEFIALVEIIGELEYIARENSHADFGFRQSPPDTNEENVQAVALKLAETLKEHSDPEILKVVMEFLELASTFTEINKAQKTVKVEKDNCMGFQCSLEDNQYALAA